MEEMKKENPGLQITALVRGENVLNDVSAEDARAVGLDRMAKIVGNGSNIGGTQMAYLGDEAREAMLDADLIISKGQGNFETFDRRGPQCLLPLPRQVSPLHQVVRYGAHVRPAAAHAPRALTRPAHHLCPTKTTRFSPKPPQADARRAPSP